MTEYNSAGSVFAPSDITVSDYLDYWLDTYCKMNLEYTTQINYVRMVNNNLKPIFGFYKLKALTPSIIQDWLNDSKRTGFSRGQLANIFNMFTAALRYAVTTCKYIPYNPCVDAKIPKYEGGNENKQRYIIPVEDFKKICERFKDTRYYISIMIGWYTGLRISEAFALTWDDIDLENDTINVNKQVVKRNYGLDVRKGIGEKVKEKNASWYFTSPKTKSSYRTIKFGKKLHDALVAEKIEQTENELKYGEYYITHVIKPEKDEKGNDIERIIPVEKSVHSNLKRVKLINVDEDGGYTSTNSFKYCSKIINYDLQIAFNYHSLRHSHATYLIENGAKPKDVQERLGHGSIQTTLNTYTHSTETMQSETVDIFEKFVTV